MADQVQDRVPDERDGKGPPKAGPPDRRPGDAAEPARTEVEHGQRRKAESEIAAGDVADDLADFA